VRCGTDLQPAHTIRIVALPVSSCSLNQFKNWNTLAFGVLSKLV
jgi:hypothetical protein